MKRVWVVNEGDQITRTGAVAIHPLDTALDQ